MVGTAGMTQTPPTVVAESSSHDPKHYLPVLFLRFACFIPRTPRPMYTRRGT